MRTHNAIIHNLIANHPRVKPNLVMQGIDPESSEPLLFFECAARPEHYVLLHNGSHDLDPDANAAMIFEWSAPGVWEQHTMFLPTCRGRKALDAGRQFLRHMFEVEGALMVWGQTPVGNRPACWFNRQLGGKSVGFGEQYSFGECEQFRLLRAEWDASAAK
jgi:hypothetical protein